jgi:hypothetical protein
VCCEDQYKFNRKLTVALKEADSHLEPRDAGAALAKQKMFEGMELLRYRQKLVKKATVSFLLNLYWSSQLFL